MTVTPSCANLTIQSSALSNTGGKVITSIVLKSKLNCSLTQTSVILNSLIGSVSNNTIVIPATTYYNNILKTIYCDGVYNFELVVGYTLSSAQYISTDTSCVFIDCETKCQVIKNYQETKDPKIIYYYYALTAASDCDNCTCTDMCSLYSEIKTLLNGTTSITNNNCGCG